MSDNEQACSGLRLMLSTAWLPFYDVLKKKKKLKKSSLIFLQKKKKNYKTANPILVQRTNVIYTSCKPTA